MEYAAGQPFRTSIESIVKTVAALKAQLVKERAQHFKGWTLTERAYAQIGLDAETISSTVRSIIEGAKAKVMPMLRLQRAS